jgi:hypothetical protein
LHFSTTKEEEKINKISQHFFFFKERCDPDVEMNS